MIAYVFSAAAFLLWTHREAVRITRITSCAPITAPDPGCIFFPMADTPSVTFTRTRLMRLHTHQCMRTGRRICAVDTLATITEKALDDMEELYNKKRRSHPDHQKSGVFVFLSALIYSSPRRIFRTSSTASFTYSPIETSLQPTTKCWQRFTGIRTFFAGL